jgi:hypothetical protein
MQLLAANIYLLAEVRFASTWLTHFKLPSRVRPRKDAEREGEIITLLITTERWVKRQCLTGE